MHNPRMEKDLAGTVSLTAIGMFGKGGGWAIPFLLHSLAVALGGIAEKPCLVNGRIESHEYLCMTIIDHDVVDGAPAACFAGQFRELLEAGAGLEQ
jgi:pyruvate/2-oxoglutarate dehydrogenase complex dihydrolipoamide acyltransferase (E2) component